MAVDKRIAAIGMMQDLAAGQPFRQRQMAARNIRIRGSFPPYDDYVRVSIGKIEDTEVFQRAFTEIFNA